MTSWLASRRSALWVALLVLGSIAGPAPAQRLARGSWWDRTPVFNSAHYVIKTDVGAPAARAFGQHLDRMYGEYARRLASLPARGPENLNVYIFQRRGDYEYTLRSRWGVNAQGTGGMFFVSPAGDGLAFWTEHLSRRRIDHVVQHEGFHQFAYSRFGGDLPRWLNEGLAEFFGEAMLINGSFVLGQTTPRVLEIVQQAVKRDEHLTFPHLLMLDDASWNDWVHTGRADLAYHQSWSMVHFLVYGDGGRYQQPFERYLRLVNHGVLSRDAFADVFGTDLNAFETRWKAYVLAAQPSAFVTALERIEVLAEGAIELSGRGVIPGSLPELIESLRAIDFAYRVNHHGRTVELTVESDSAFEIPADVLTPKQPVFAVTKPKLRLRTVRDRQLEEIAPIPCAIRTRDLRPRDLSIMWRRDEETGGIEYEIVVARR